MSIFKEIAKKAVLFIYNALFYIIPFKKDIILFESSVGRNYSGNPRYIYEEMLRQSLDKKYKLVWILNDTKTEIPGVCEKIKRARFKYFYYSIIAKLWIFDSRQHIFLKKKDSTKYIQTWHGTPLKKLVLDMETLNMGGDQDLKGYQEKFLESVELWDYLISQNEFSTETLKRAFSFKKEVIESGYPRNDILVNKNNSSEIEKLKDKYNIPKNKKVILYAPTWRDDYFHSNGIYKFFSDLNLGLLQNELNDEYVLLIKYHYLVKDKINWAAYGDFIMPFNETIDIQELYLISDILITDYSSVMFDYSVLRRPMFFYISDFGDYRNNLRGFYFNMFEECPGPIVKNTQDLISEIKYYEINEYMDKYSDKYNMFVSKYAPWDDGNSSKRIINLVSSIMK